MEVAEARPPRDHLLRAGPRVLVLAASVLLLWSTAAAVAAEPPVRILSPSPEALITGHRVVVRMKVAPGVSDLRLHLDGRALRTGGPAGAGGVRTATASVKGLPGGHATLTLDARRRGHRISAYRLLVLGRRSPGILREVRLAHRAAGAVRMRVRLGGRISAFEVSVNGRRAKMIREPSGPTPRGVAARLRPPGRARPAPSSIIPLSADDGLRPGRNRVVVLAYREKTGRWARSVRSVWMSPRVPMIAAGQDRRIFAGSTLRLDGSDSRPSRAGERLHYRWRIVAQPKLPRALPAAHLLDPSAVRPRLVTHRPGTYQVALHLVPGGGSPNHAEGSTATASTASAPSEVGDVITADAEVKAPPYGIRMTANQPVESGVRRTTIDYAEGRGGVPDQVIETPAGEVGLIVLNRSSLVVESTASYPYECVSGVPRGTAPAFESAYSTGAEQLAILTGGGASAESGCETVEATPPGVHFALREPFTLITTNSRTIARNVGGEQGGGRGAVSGVLRKVAEPKHVRYSFLYPEAVEFDTYVEGEGSTLYTEIGKQKYPIETGGAPKGIAITALNLAFERIPSLSGTYPLQGNSTDAGTLQQVAARLGEISSQDYGGVLLIQTLGGPGPASEPSEWATIGQALRNFGGTPSVWKTPGSGNYALVGTVYPGNGNPGLRSVSTFEASGPLEAGEARAALKPWVGTARGVIGRGENGDAVLRAGTSIPRIQDTRTNESLDPAELIPLAEAPPKPWLLTGEGKGAKEVAYEEALSWISQKIGEKNPNTGIREGLGDPNGSQSGVCEPPPPEKWDARVEYCNVNLTDDWSTYAGQLKGLDCPRNEAFEKVQCEEMIAQLEQEFEYIPTVTRLLENLQKPIAGAKSSAVASYNEIASHIENELLQANQEASLSGAKVSDAILGPLQDLDFEDILGADPEIGLALGLLESAIDLGSQSSATSDSEPAVSPFAAAKGQIGTEAVARLEDAASGIGRLEDLLLSDWTKLSTTATRAASVSGLTTEEIEEIGEDTQNGAEAALYEALMPVAYSQLQIGHFPKPMTLGLLKEEFECQGYSRKKKKRHGWEPFKNASSPNAFYEPVGENLLLILTTTQEEYADTPGEALMGKLFEPPAGQGGGGVGLYPAPFFEWNWADNVRALREFEEDGETPIFENNLVPIGGWGENFSEEWACGE